tara:strand:+ start:130 stop:1425 length:1296 start_codon:yes stop_codon:yes gene_type:complete
MKIIITSLVLIIFNINQVLAVTLKEALRQAFDSNTELNAERENLKISKEELNISKSNYLPSFTISGSKSREETNKLTNRDGSDATITNVDPEIKTLKVEQTLVDFGRSADYKKNEIGIQIAEAKLLKKEQEIIYKAIEAYSGLVLANKKLTINQRNINLLERQVETDSIRLERGQISISDLAQSQSSLAGAQAQYIQAKNDLMTFQLSYENVIGKIKDFSNLEIGLSSISPVPTSLNVSINLSKKNSPNLIIAKLEFDQSAKDVEIAKSDLTPSADLSFERTYSDDLSSTVDEREKDVLKATITWPFFSGGKNRATLNKNKNLRTRKELLLKNTQTSNETNVASAWSNLQTSKSFLESVRSQVKSAEIAYEGITSDYERGSGRTTLEVIQSNTLLLNSQLSLASSERNYLLAQYNLLKTIGLLNSNYLKLK